MINLACFLLFQLLQFIQVVLQGAAVTLAELGEYTRAASLLEDLTKVGSNWVGTSSPYDERS